MRRGGSKYDHVSSRLDTGRTVDKVKTISARQYLKRQDETFLRVSPPQLYELFEEYENDAEELHPAAHGAAGGGPVMVCHAETATAQYERPYLLLDVRERADYETCRILQARSFPASQLNQDRMIPELLRFKNREGWLIILYDENERNAVATRAATQLMDRGFDNIFVLTKGLVGFGERFPSYCEGELPEQPSPTRAGRSSSGRSSTARSNRSSASSVRSPASPTGSQASRASARSTPSRSYGTPNSARRHSHSRHSNAAEDMDEVRSDMSQMSVAESVISRSASRKGRPY